jgi:hypothetical protein
MGHNLDRRDGTAKRLEGNCSGSSLGLVLGNAPVLRNPLPLRLSDSGRQADFQVPVGVRRRNPLISHPLCPSVHRAPFLYYGVSLGIGQVFRMNLSHGYWPPPLAHCGQLLLNPTDEYVTIGEIMSEPRNNFKANRILYTALVPAESLDTVLNTESGLLSDVHRQHQPSDRTLAKCRLNRASPAVRSQEALSQGDRDFCA